MNELTKPAAGGYKHASKFNVRNIVYHALGGDASKGIVTAVCIRENGTKTYEVTWQDRSVSWAAECELSAEPVKSDFETADAE